MSGHIGSLGPCLQILEFSVGVWSTRSATKTSARPFAGDVQAELSMASSIEGPSWPSSRCCWVIHWSVKS